jgi:hypothetical protein
VTIIASVKVRDGLILGTDSMTQVSVPGPSGPQVVKAYSNARKLFQVGELPIGVMTYGLGNVGHRSIEGLVIDFSRTYDGQPAVEDIAQGLYNHVCAQYEDAFSDVAEPERDAVGFFVAGYSPDAPFPEEHEFVIPRDEGPSATRGAEVFGASWRGVDAPFGRLYKGIDPRIAPVLRARGLSDSDIDELVAQLETQVVYDGMPVQDAINFATYILDTTIGWSTFALGQPACGRPLQVATILSDDGFTWVAKPNLSVRGA